MLLSVGVGERRVRKAGNYQLAAQLWEVEKAVAIAEQERKCFALTLPVAMINHGKPPEPPLLECLYRSKDGYEVVIALSRHPDINKGNNMIDMWIPEHRSLSAVDSQYRRYGPFTLSGYVVPFFHLFVGADPVFGRRRQD